MTGKTIFRAGVIVSIIIVIVLLMFAGALALIKEAVNSDTVSGVAEAVVRGCMGTPPYEQDRIERIGVFKLPDSGENLTQFSTTREDNVCTIYIRFDMSSTEPLDPLLINTYVETVAPASDEQYQRFTVQALGAVDWEFADDTTNLYGKGGIEQIQQEMFIQQGEETSTVYLITLLIPPAEEN